MPWLTEWVFAWKRNQQWVTEDCFGFFKADSVLPMILLGLLVGPFEYQRIESLDYLAKLREQELFVLR